MFIWRRSPLLLQQRYIKIGETTYPIQEPTSPPHVPRSPLPLTQNVLQTVRWMLQKDLLGQDMFLMGHPGPTRRWLALKYCEVACREVEFLTLSRDTTEVDIKQRREIRGDSVLYVHQPAVTAALLGRVLVLEGIEKAERNVLPVINNLLENREMRLEDGSFLMNPRRYDELRGQHSEEEMRQMGLHRVSPRFRVVAIGLPVPKYRGTPLDPPLRSRFQCRAVHTPGPEEVLELLRGNGDLQGASIPPHVTTMLTVLSAITEYTRQRTDQDRASIVPSVLSHVDITNWLRYQELFPASALGASLSCFYPWANHAAISAEVLDKFSCAPCEGNYKLESIQTNKEVTGIATVTFSTKTTFGFSKHVTRTVPCGTELEAPDPQGFVETDAHAKVLCAMLQAHSLGHHICLIGPSGSGKTALVRAFAAALKYGSGVETQHMFTDMTTRDLLQRRVTLKSGDTSWELTPLMRAAIEGRIAVLDGIDALPDGALSTIQQLLCDSRITLLDGTVVLPAAAYDALPEGADRTKVLRVHSGFRVIATARPPKSNTQQRTWLNEDVAGMFAFHTLPEVTASVVDTITTTIFPRVPRSMTKSLLSLAQSLVERNRDDSLIPTLSLRHLLRLHKRAEANPDDSQAMRRCLNNVFLTDLMPGHAAKTIHTLITQAGFPKPVAVKQPELQVTTLPNGDIKVSAGEAISVTVPTSTYTPHTRSLIPSIIYFDNEQHTNTLAAMLEDYALGFHMLLIGNQGVGKNKIVDKFLQTLQLPRQYIQLHRDTTVPSLTLSPNVVKGALVWEDSPMIKAVQEGHVLVVDEIDKAPVEVVSVLKGLLEDREMTLGDGRRIGADLKIHPQFRVIALANRPGYPFLGNDFFKSCGDMLSCHAITNPDKKSQLALLSKYGPKVPYHILTVLAEAFAEIDKFVDQGVLTYPYSLREMANVVRHMNDFPEDGIATALLNVFHFDDFDENTRDMILNVFRNAGIPLHGGETQFAKRLRDLSAQDHSYVRSGTPIGQLTFTKTESFISVTRLGLSPVPQPLIGLSTKSSGLEIVLEKTPSDPLTFTEILSRLSLTGDKDGTIDHIVAAKPGSLVLFFTSGKVVVCRFDQGYRPSSFETRTYEILKREVKVVKVVSMAPEGTLAILTSDGSLTIIHAENLTGKTFAGFLTDTSHVTMNTFGQGESLLLCSGRQVSFVSPRNDESLMMMLPEPPQTVRYVELVAGPGIVTTLSNSAVAQFIPLREGVHAPTLYSGSLPVENVSAVLASTANVVMGGGVLLHDTQRPLCPEEGKPNNVYALNYPAQHSVPPAGARMVDGYNGNRSVITLTSNYIEISDLVTDSYRRVQLDSVDVSPERWCWFPGDDVLAVTTHSGNRVILFDASRERYHKWKALYSQPVQKDLEMTYNVTDKEASMDIKHGKEDPNNEPHVGGNQWAGGTGGSDTAGLGGRVGPYRLDKGHKIHQVPKYQKDSVPQHIKDEAKRIGREALQKRLAEINMTERENQMYEEAFYKVRNEIQILRAMLLALKSKQGERVWQRNQVEGVLDDTKIVDGIAGDKGVFKRRAESKDAGFIKHKKKRMMFVVDCSASMYRFNSHDGRLDREVESIIMLMEALADSSDTISYSVVAHSGDEANIVLVDFDKPPKNKKERLQVCLKMIAHTQYCMSGDNTVEAMRLAVAKITTVDADSYSIFVISDANLEQYGIRPTTLARIIKSDERVEMYCIFIATLGHQAKQIQQSLPVGHGHVCFSASEMPQVLKRIFVSHDHLMGGV